MRKILTISLTENTAKVVKKAVKDGNYTSTSEFFRRLLRDWQEGKLLNELLESKTEIESGDGKALHSLKSLR